MKEKFSTRILVEIAIFAAIGFALDIFQGGLFRGVFASGGSIGIAMVPVFIIAYRRGFLAGFLCGLTLSLIQMLGGIYVVNGATFDNKFLQVMGPFIQVMLDYVLAYTVVGLVGVFAGSYKKSETMGKKIFYIIIGTVIAGLLKYACHVIAGGVFWLGDGSDGFWGASNDTWLYSFVYNGAYMIPNIVLSTTIMVIIARFYPNLLNPNQKIEAEEELDENVEENKVEVNVNETESN